MCFVCVLACSDSEMEIESEHYSNGVAERTPAAAAAAAAARVVNGTYKHQEVLQTDTSSSSSSRVKGTHTRTRTSTHAHTMLIFFLKSI